jgi:cell division protein FtsI/penicillin-binding protein 2
MVSPTVLAVEAESPIYQRALDEGTARHTRKLLRRVVTEGTGRRAQSDQYRIWGKTGTAQIPDREEGGYKSRAYTASFLCGAPMRDPELIVLVSVHEPDPSIGYYGGIVSAPVAKRIIERSLPYLGVPPDQPDAEEPTADSPLASSGG